MKNQFFSSVIKSEFECKGAKYVVCLVPVGIRECFDEICDEYELAINRVDPNGEINCITFSDMYLDKEGDDLTFSSTAVYSGDKFDIKNVNVEGLFETAIRKISYELLKHTTDVDDDDNYFDSVTFNLGDWNDETSEDNLTDIFRREHFFIEFADDLEEDYYASYSVRLRFSAYGKEYWNTNSGDFEP